MTNLADVRSDPAPPPLPGRTRELFRWVCTSNPFYVLSALLFCLGLWVSFGGQVVASQTWALLSGMAGYTLLLAVTACLLVRFVGVWDDVRTVLLLVVLMFLATSVTFDEVLARDPERGIICYVVGTALRRGGKRGDAPRGVRLTLPPLFRVPYYLSLALFFLYPVAIAPLLDSPRSESLFWALFGFSPAAWARGVDPRARRPSWSRLCPRQRQPLAVGVVSLDPVRAARLRGPGEVGAPLLVDAPCRQRLDRTLHLRTLLPRPVRALRRRPLAGDRASWSGSRGCSSRRCPYPRSWSPWR